MTQTDELRKLLDERGIEWEAHDDEVYRITRFWSPRLCEARQTVVGHPDGDGFLHVEAPMKLEQVADALLGRETCTMDTLDNLNESEGMGDVWVECSECHWQCDYDYVPMPGKFKFCPNCGRRVV